MNTSSPTQPPSRSGGTPASVRRAVTAAICAILVMVVGYSVTHFIILPRIDAHEDVWRERARLAGSAERTARNFSGRLVRYESTGDTSALRRAISAIATLRERVDTLSLVFHDSRIFVDTLKQLDARIAAWIPGVDSAKLSTAGSALLVTPEYDPTSAPASDPLSTSLVDGFEAFHDMADDHRRRIGWWEDTIQSGALVFFIVGLLAVLATLLRLRAVLLDGMRETTDQRAALEQQAEELSAANKRLVAEMVQQRELQDQLRQSQKMDAVGQLAGGVAHDFNNLLTVIRGHVELLLIGDCTEQSRADLESAKRATDQASALTSKLLSFSRKQVMTTQVVELNNVVEEVEPMLRRLLPADIALRWVRASGRQHLRVDSVYLEQVIMNLVVNAKDAMPDGGSIAMETSSEDDPQYARFVNQYRTPGEKYAVLAVHDTGTGMSDEVREKAFQPFFTTKDPGKGTGLGLATVYGITHQSGGHVHLESSVGVGTTVIIMLPLVDEPTATIAEAARAVPSAKSGETILLVDDNADLLAMATRMLDTLGYSVITARDGEEALATVRAKSYDISLILSDVVMPGLTGPAMVATLRSEGLAPQVVLMSGHAGDELAVRGLVPGTYTLLKKPFTLVQLATTVRRAIDEECEALSPVGGGVA